ncbi:MAG: hypothetical protein OEV42_01760 [Deltaproteobacteria bacterium]|nr:hypothetical protein [Deltaproteobacteria bacterium]
MSNFDKAKKWIENREKDLARSVIKYKLSKEGKSGIDENTLDSGAERVVLEANKIVRERGREVISDISRGIERFVKKVRK